MSALTTSTDDTDTDRVVSGGVPSRLRGNPWAIGIGVPVLFVLLILGANFLGKALDFPQYNYDTETAQLIVSGWPWLVLETAFALAVLWWTGLRVQGRPRWGQYVLLAVGVYLVFGVIVFLNEWNRGGAVDWYLLIGVFAALSMRDSSGSCWWYMWRP